MITFFMFGARGFSAAAFSWVYLYSVEVRTFVGVINVAFSNQLMFFKIEIF